MSGCRRSAGSVRQLSLQQPVPRRQIIRKQRSADDGKPLKLDGGPGVRDRYETNIRNGPDRAKVRIAWGETNKGNNSERQVEVVAHRIPGRVRPTTGKFSRTFAGTEKPPILYSRQELAERLRLAWKHREKNKANIDIFLAHASVEKRCDSELSNPAVSVPPTPLPKEKPTENDENRAPEYCRSTRKEERQEVVRKLVSRESDSSKVNDSNGSRDEMYKSGKSITASNPIEQTVYNGKTEKKLEVVQDKITRQNNTEENKPEDTSSGESSPETARKNCISINCTNLQPAAVTEKADTVSLPKPAKDDFSSAKQKRASFHSGNNRAFLHILERPVPDGKTVARRNSTSEKIGRTAETIVRANSETKIAFSEKPRSASHADRNSVSSTVEIARQGSIFERTVPTRTTEIRRFDQKKRTSSAPPQRQSGNRLQVNILIDTPGILKSTEKIEDCQQKLETDQKENSSKISCARQTRSASIRRRSKTRKRLLTDRSSCKEEENGKSHSRSGRRKNSGDSKTSDVVTMVSLVSSADSDSDEGNSPSDDKLISELRNKLPTTPIIKTSMGARGIVRKPVKSVSFQKDSLDESASTDQQVAKEEKKTREPRFVLSNKSPRILNEEPVSWRTDIPGLALPVLTLCQETEEATEVPLTDREKRCLAVPIGDLHDKKRKLLKTRSATPRSITMEKQSATMESKEQKATVSRVDFSVQQTNEENPPPKYDSEYVKIKPQVNSLAASPRKDEHRVVSQKESSEPQFQTSKEKECWHLYKRMCDKGVYVSFDTVLRGMLTPTEYRLRQKEILQDL